MTETPAQLSYCDYCLHVSSKDMISYGADSYFLSLGLSVPVSLTLKQVVDYEDSRPISLVPDICA